MGYGKAVIVPVLDTGIYATGEVLFDFTEMVGFFKAGGGAEIKSVTVIDQSDQGVAMDLYIARAAGVLGPLNAVPNISDAADIAAQVELLTSIAVGDYKDLGGLKQATKVALSLPVQAVAGGTSLWLGGITQGGTPTYLVNSLQIMIGFQN